MGNIFKSCKGNKSRKKVDSNVSNILIFPDPVTIAHGFFISTSSSTSSLSSSSIDCKLDQHHHKSD